MNNLDLTYTPLHLHTTASLLDGINRIPELVKYLKNNNINSCAITDHGTLSGWIEFYKACKKEGIKPILAVEAYLTDNEDYIDDPKAKINDNYHAVLIAKNDTGVKNIIWLTNQANLNNFYYRPRISFKNLAERAEGIICTSSCLGGLVKNGNVRPRKVKKEDFEWKIHQDKCYERIDFFKDAFPDRFYLELQHNGIPKQYLTNAFMQEAAIKKNLPLIMTTDAHFLRKEDKPLHDLVMAQQLKTTLDEYQSDEDDLAYTEHHYVKTPKEMYKVAEENKIFEAFHNTNRIAEECNVTLNLGELQYPKFNFNEETDYQEFKKWEATHFECCD